jgi:hypothetical protein
MTLDLTAHLVRQMVFSRATFGPGARTKGVLDHIRKEVVEVEESAGSAEEWVDIVILALDGLTRQLWSTESPTTRADIVASIAVGMIVGKQGRNELRNWPDWRKAPADTAIEHIRD